MKSYLSGGQGRLDTVFEEYSDMARNQLKEILGSFNESLTKTYRLVHQTSLFVHLKCKVSYKAMELLIKEYDKGVQGMYYPQYCDCATKVRDGMLCVHDLATCVKKQMPIQPVSLHPFWSTLSLEEVDTQCHLETKKNVARRLFDEFYEETWNTLSPHDQEKCIESVRKIAKVDTPLKEPPISKHTGGRP